MIGEGNMSKTTHHEQKPSKCAKRRERKREKDLLAKKLSEMGQEERAKNEDEENVQNEDEVKDWDELDETRQEDEATNGEDGGDEAEVPEEPKEIDVKKEEQEARVEENKLNETVAEFALSVKDFSCSEFVSQ